MLYSGYEFGRRWLAGASYFAQAQSDWLSSPANPFSYLVSGPMLASALEVFAHAAAPRGKPKFEFAYTEIYGKKHAISETIECRKPFGQLRHFVREGAPEGQPKLLIVAPMSGHYATLLRGTVERLLPGHDIWITDWRDARNAALADGKFDLDDYVDYLVAFLEHIGEGAHMLAVCQPSVPCFAAAALMAEDKNSCRPKSLTMMGGPIDTRNSPTAVNKLAVERPHSWFANNVVCTVPQGYRGAGRRVYPGFLQLTGFMTMNLGNHMLSHWEMYKHLVEGDEESADATKDFYEEYRSVCDMTAEFYLQTIEVVFQRHAIAKGEYLHRGRLVDASKIKDIAILAVEGERDDISGLGQTKAALSLASKLPESKKHYHMAPHVGHYGIFNGRRWREEIAPVVEDWIAKNNG